MDVYMHASAHTLQAERDAAEKKSANAMAEAADAKVGTVTARPDELPVHHAFAQLPPPPAITTTTTIHLASPPPTIVARPPPPRMLPRPSNPSPLDFQYVRARPLPDGLE
eukprot:3116144-Pleurochrysis_carterae.AAC.1